MKSVLSEEPGIGMPMMLLFHLYRSVFIDKNMDRNYEGRMRALLGTSFIYTSVSYSVLSKSLMFNLSVKTRDGESTRKPRP